MKTRKIVALLLAVVMVLAMSASAFAADDTYSTVTDSATGLTVKVSTGVENLEFVTPTHGTTYEIGSTITGYFPQNFSLMFSTGTGVSVNFEFTAPVSDGYGAVSMGNAAAVLTVTNAAGSFTIYCPAPVFNTDGASGIVAYLPAPAQFVNEGVTVGGWGDAFTSTAGQLKPLVNAYSATGVSLGSFGGYVVLDFGAPAKNSNGEVISGIYNDPTNAYGVDFILYGNALSTWAEPGCVQVSLNGEDWYDIAGSLHYRLPAATKVDDGTFSVSSAGAVWNYTATYTDQKPTDQTKYTNADNNLGEDAVAPIYTFTSIARPDESTVTGNGTITLNNWHRHNWFPLTCNYFRNRTVAGVTLGDLLGKPLANLDLAAHFGTVKSTNASVAMTLAFNCVKLMPKKNSSNIGSTAPDDFLFGYADCHQNGTANGTQVSPYELGRTSGGDPIDLSWAVYPAGTEIDGEDVSGLPADLAAIRYVRVYTGVQQLNGIMGESSTEITGAFRATGVGSGEFDGMDVPSVVDHNGERMEPEYMGFAEIEEGFTTIEFASENTFVNGQKVTGDSYEFEIHAGEYVQIITQSGTASPYITVLRGK